jgi:hypothetical protein
VQEQGRLRQGGQAQRTPLQGRVIEGSLEDKRTNVNGMAVSTIKRMSWKKDVKSGGKYRVVEKLGKGGTNGGVRSWGFTKLESCYGSRFFSAFLAAVEIFRTFNGWLISPPHPLRVAKISHSFWEEINFDSDSKNPPLILVFYNGFDISICQLELLLRHTLPQHHPVTGVGLPE